METPCFSSKTVTLLIGPDSEMLILWATTSSNLNWRSMPTVGAWRKHGRQRAVLMGACVAYFAKTVSLIVLASCSSNKVQRSLNTPAALAADAQCTTWRRFDPPSQTNFLNVSESFQLTRSTTKSCSLTSACRRRRAGGSTVGHHKL